MIRRDPPECPGITGPLWRFAAFYGSALLVGGLIGTAIGTAAAWVFGV